MQNDSKILNEFEQYSDYWNKKGREKIVQNNIFIFRKNFFLNIKNQNMIKI